MNVWSWTANNFFHTLTVLMVALIHIMQNVGINLQNRKDCAFDGYFMTRYTSKLRHPSLNRCKLHTM